MSSIEIYGTLIGIIMEFVLPVNYHNRATLGDGSETLYQ
jgi:hypothetical protein